MMRSRCELPLTLTLSPQAGRGNVPRSTWAMTRRVVARPTLAGDGEVAATALLPVWTGRRCRQADEGRTEASSNKTSEGAIHVPRS